jgi:Tfp pilus assembly PilM family ATPase
MANIFFGRGKKNHLIVDTSLLGLRGIFVNQENEEEPVLEKAFSSRWSSHLTKSPDDFEKNLQATLKSFAAYFPPRQFLVTFCSSDPSNREKFVQIQNIDEEDELEEYLISKKLMKASEDFLTDVHVIGPSISEIKSHQDLIIHSVQRELAQYVMDTLEETGYELEALEFPSNSLIPFHNLFCEQAENQTDALVYIGWEVSMVSVFFGGVRRFSHMLNFRLLDLMRLLVDKLGVDEDFALQLVREELFEVLLDGKEGRVQYPEDLMNEIREEMDYLLDELKRSLIFYSARVVEWKVEAVDRIFFTGLETRIDPFYNLIASSFPIPSKRIVPIEEIRFSDEVNAKIPKGAERDDFTLSFGLALRHLT